MMEVIKLKNKSGSVTLKGIILSMEDDSDQYIANPEWWLRMKTNDGQIYAFRGDGVYFTPKAKSLKKYGRFRRVD